MEINEKELEQGILVTISGKLDAMTSVDAQKRLLKILDEEKSNLIIDFKNIAYVSSAGLCALLMCAKRSKELGVFICLVNVNAMFREILETTGFYSYIRIFDNLDMAIVSLDVKK